MSYPLIQDPAPLMQLAQTVTAIRQRFLDRQMQQEEMRRRYAYMKLAQQEQAANEAFRNRQITIAEANEAFRNRQITIAEANAAEDAKYRALAAEQQALMNRFAIRQADLATKRQSRMDLLSGLPDNVSIPDPRDQAAYADQGLLAGKTFAGPTVSPEAARMNQAMRQDEAMNLGQNIATAQSRSRPGIVPRPGQSGGVVFSPRPYGVSVSLGGSGGAGGISTQDRLMQAAIGGALDQVVALENLERSDPNNATIPMLTAGIEGAGTFPVVGGTIRGFLGPTSQAIMSPEQQQYQAMAGEFIHTYASSLPGRRLGPELLKVIHHNFFPRSGQNDPATIERFRIRRREAAIRMARAAAGEPVDLESLLDIASRSELDRIAPREATPTAPSSITAPTPGTRAPRNRFFGP